MTDTPQFGNGHELTHSLSILPIRFLDENLGLQSDFHRNKLWVIKKNAGFLAIFSKKLITCGMCPISIKFWEIYYLTSSQYIAWYHPFLFRTVNFYKTGLLEVGIYS